MTVLIGTVSQSNIVITADGLSKRSGNVENDELQKIFPVDDMPLAIAHHGINILNGHSVGEFLAPLITDARRNFSTLGLLKIACRVRDFADSAAKVVLLNLADYKVGFWVAGFDRETSMCRLYEICWPDNSAPNEFKRAVGGGDGKNFLEWPHGWEKIVDSPVGSVLRLHNELYQKALENQAWANKTIFGGQKHQLLITRDGCKWIIVPSPAPRPAPSPSPGFND